MAKFLLAPSDHSDLARRIREAIGVGPEDEVECQTPQFERTDGKRILYFPQTAEQFDRLKTLDAELLREIGLQAWDSNGLWLFPCEWYDHIPDGYEVTDIFYKREPFQRGTTDNDMRFGALGFGIVAEFSALKGRL